MLFDVVDRVLVALQPVDLTTQAEREELEWQLARSSEAVAGLDLIPLRRASPGEYGLGGGVVGITSERELALVQVVDALDELGVAALLATVARLFRTPLAELTANVVDGSGSEGADEEDFASAWERLTGEDRPSRWTGRPQVLLAAGSFSPASVDMLQLLAGGSLSIDAFTISAWRRSSGLALDLQPVLVEDAEAESDQDSGRPRRPRRSYMRAGRAIRVVDLIDAGLLEVGEELTILRPRSGGSLALRVAAGGGLVVPDGRVLSSPSAAAAVALGVPAVAGWTTIVASGRGGQTLADLRDALLEASAERSTVTETRTVVDEPSSLVRAVASTCAPETLAPAPESAGEPFLSVASEDAGIDATDEPPRRVDSYSIWSRALAKGQAEPILPTTTVLVPPPPPAVDRDTARWEDANLDPVVEQP